MARGMVTLEVNGAAVTTPEQFKEQLQEGVNRLYIWSSGTNQFIVIRIQE
jgi:hypothetical protein